MTQDKELTDFQKETQRAILMDKDYYSPSEAAALNRLNAAAQEALTRGRHPDFEIIRADFHDLRDGRDAEKLYQKFLMAYGLDESQPYQLDAQKKLQQFKLKSPTHLRVKEAYPMFGPGYWDSFITGRQKASHVKIRSDEAVKLMVRGLGKRRLNIKLGGGEY